MRVQCRGLGQKKGVVRRCAFVPFGSVWHCIIFKKIVTHPNGMSPIGRDLDGFFKEMKSASDRVPNGILTDVEVK